MKKLLTIKLKIMKQKFSHNDIQFLVGVTTILALVVYNALTHGISV